MADHAAPHFANDAGVPSIRVGVREFMCVGARPPFDHPHIFLDMGDADEIICGYCSTLYTFDPSLHGSQTLPEGCAFETSERSPDANAAGMAAA